MHIWKLVIKYCPRETLKKQDQRILWNSIYTQYINSSYNSLLINEKHGFLTTLQIKVLIMLNCLIGKYTLLHSELYVHQENVYPAIVWYRVLIKGSNKLQCYLVVDLLKLLRYLITWRATIRNGNSINADVIDDTIGSDYN
jgi:hypothetical protein